MYCNIEIIDGIEKCTIRFLEEPKCTPSEAVKWLEETSRQLDSKSPKYYNEVVINSRITLKMPGKYDSKYPGDYLLIWDDSAPTHKDVCEALIKCIANKEKYIRWMSMIEDVYYNGTKNLEKYIDEQERFAVQLLFWVTLQEDINRVDRLGRQTPLCRYVEAISTTQDGNKFSFDDVIERIDCDDPARLERLELPMISSFYKWSAF